MIDRRYILYGIFMFFVNVFGYPPNHCKIISWAAKHCAMRRCTRFGKSHPEEFGTTHQTRACLKACEHVSTVFAPSPSECCNHSESSRWCSLTKLVLLTDASQATGIRKSSLTVFQFDFRLGHNVREAKGSRHGDGLFVIYLWYTTTDWVFRSK